MRIGVRVDSFGRTIWPLMWRRPLPLIVVAALSALALAACGGGADDVAVEADADGEQSAAPRSQDEEEFLELLFDGLEEEAGLPAHVVECLRSYVEDNGYADDLSFIDDDDFPEFSFDLALAELPPAAQELFTGIALGAERCMSVQDLEDFAAAGGGNLDGPDSYGSHPVLDTLWDGCEAGSLSDCDMLYLSSPMPSEYEDFAFTCGGRNEPLSHADMGCMLEHDDFSEIESVKHQCEQGFFPACDLLAAASAAGSAEQSLGSSCGDRRDPAGDLTCFAEFGFGSR